MGKTHEFVISLLLFAMLLMTTSCGEGLIPSCQKKCDAKGFDYYDVVCPGLGNKCQCWCKPTEGDLIRLD